MRSSARSARCASELVLARLHSPCGSRGRGETSYYTCGDRLKRERPLDSWQVVVGRHTVELLHLLIQCFLVEH